MWGSQLGKTMLLVSLIAYSMQCDAGPTMLVAPNETSVRELMGTRIYPTFDASPNLKGMLLPEHLRTMVMLKTTHGLMFCAWSGSVTKLGEKSIRYLLCTEVDKYSREITGEADSLDLATERTKAFPNPKIIYESTPTIEGSSRVEALYLASDRRRYHMPCPHCNEYQDLIPEQLRWPHGDDGHSVAPEVARENTYYECVLCRKAIRDIHKPAMLQAGRWLREGETIDTSGRVSGCDTRVARRVGFHLSTLYSPIVPWGKVAQKWIEASHSRDPNKIQNIVNGWYARTWAPPARRMDNHEILAARGIDLGLEYDEGTCPLRPNAIIVSADIQEREIWYVVRAWCANGKSYLLRYGYVEQPNDFDKLQIENQHEFMFPGGAARAGYVFVDTGYRTKETYEACKRYNWNAMKGHDHEGMSVLQAKDQRVSAVRLWSFRAPVYKDRLFSLIHHTPLDGAGSWMLHRGTGLDYARQVSAEQRQLLRDKSGRDKYAWVKVYRQNHFLDCETMNLAAAEIIGMDKVESAIGAGSDARTSVEANLLATADAELRSYDPLAGLSVKDWN